MLPSGGLRRVSDDELPAIVAPFLVGRKLLTPLSASLAVDNSALLVAATPCLKTEEPIRLLGMSA